MSTVQFSPRQKAYIRKKSKHHDLDPSEAAGELNIVPFLDIVVNIIMCLLLMTAYIVAASELDARLPITSRGGRAGANPEATLNLSVTIAENGIIVAGSGGKLAPGCTNMQPGRVITVVNLPNSAADPNNDGLPDIYDWPGLTRCLATVKSQFPDESQVIVSADPNVEYRHLIAAMDAMRADGELPLFPEIMLSAGVR
jgi:biopolymer transport protein TolR